MSILHPDNLNYLFPQHNATNKICFCNYKILNNFKNQELTNNKIQKKAKGKNNSHPNVIVKPMQIVKCPTLSQHQDNKWDLSKQKEPMTIHIRKWSPSDERK